MASVGQESLGFSHQTEIYLSAGAMILSEAQEPGLNSLLFLAELCLEVIGPWSCFSAGSQPGPF